MLLNWTKARAVVQSGNHVAAGIHDFHELLGIESFPRSWEVRQLEPAAEMGAQAIQRTKDKAPSVAAAGVILLGGAVLKNKFQGKDPTS